MEMKCRIINSGTAKVGIKLIGRTVIALVAIPCGLMNRAATPIPTALTRSAMPSSCQKMKLFR